LVLGCGRGLTVDGQPALIEPNLETIAKADKGVSSEALASLDALEQEPRPKGLELQIRRDRRV
jgi:hypothetical protein